MHTYSHTHINTHTRSTPAVRLHPANGSIHFHRRTWLISMRMHYRFSVCIIILNHHLSEPPSPITSLQSPRCVVELYAYCSTSILTTENRKHHRHAQPQSHRARKHSFLVMFESIVRISFASVPGLRGGGGFSQNHTHQTTGTTRHQRTLSRPHALALTHRVQNGEEHQTLSLGTRPLSELSVR